MSKIFRAEEVGFEIMYLICSLESVDQLLPSSYLIWAIKVNIPFTVPIFCWRTVQQFIALNSIVVHSQLQYDGRARHVVETRLGRCQMLKREDMPKAQTAVFDKKLLRKLQQD
jgi:hypothetical protein